MSNVIEYHFVGDRPGGCDGEITLDSPLMTNVVGQRKATLKVESIHLSGFIITISDGTGPIHKNDEFLLTWKNGGVTVNQPIVMPSPSYVTTPTLFNETIDSVFATYSLLLNPTEPALRFEQDPTTMKAIIWMDATKLAAGITDLVLDITPANTNDSQLASDLGFVTTTYFTTIGYQLWTSDYPVRLNVQGPFVDVICSCAPVRKRNNGSIRLLASVEVSPLMNSGLIAYPTAGIQPIEILFTAGTRVETIKFQFRTIDGKQFQWLTPYAHVVFGLTY